MIFSITKATKSLAFLRNHVEEEDGILSGICITSTIITLRLKDISMGMIIYRTYNEKDGLLNFSYLFKEKQLRN